MELIPFIIFLCSALFCIVSSLKQLFKAETPQVRRLAFMAAAGWGTCIVWAFLWHSIYMHLTALIDAVSRTIN